ncbi:MAG: hypothetical protein AAF718_09145 [Pseudomonadota bacterium]
MDSLEQTLTYPNMRSELRRYLMSLANSRDPEKGWRAASHLGGELDFAIQFLFDDTVLAKDARKAVGVFLLDETEAAFIADLVQKLDAVLTSKGTSLSDKDAVGLPAWENVAHAAQKALDTLEF